MPSLKTKVLLVEDDAVLGYMLTHFLDQHNFEVTLCINGETAWGKFMKYKYDICLLDIILPGKKDGIALAKNIRQKNDDIPVMLLSSNIQESEIINCFEHGIDGYLIKPYNFDELLLRIQVFLKRSKKEPDDMPNHFTLGNLEFYYYELLLKNHKLEYELTHREAELLRYLCINANRVIRRDLNIQTIPRVGFKFNFNNN